ncbi:MAG: hypothetical protein DRP12_00150 [Candidatus Aenigmatarchaeota archaeon]|nr:MAG: hypothetical protein DRP12_00150 [Candidatus Aenigmarchaeota archaeon]
MPQVFVNNIYVGDIPEKSLNELMQRYNEITGGAVPDEYRITVSDRGKLDLNVYVTPDGNYVYPELTPLGYVEPNQAQRVLMYLLGGAFLIVLGYAVGRLLKR